MTRIPALRPGATREELLSSSRLSDLVEVASQGAEVAAILKRIREPGEEPEKGVVPLSHSLNSLAEVLMEYFRSVLNYAENREQLEEVEKNDRV